MTHTTKKKASKEDSSVCSSCCSTSEGQTMVSSGHWAEAGIMLVMIAAVFQILKTLNIVTFSQAIEGSLGLGAIVLIGLAASVSSCLAMVGGLLLSVSASWTQAHPTASRWHRLQPLVTFNVGRLLGYFLLGGVTGLLGKSVLLSLHATGMLKIALAFVMVFLGLKLLGLIPAKYCRIPLPRSMTQALRKMSTTENSLGAGFLGALTYFIPCGFTQSMQILALASGGFMTGAMIMLAFAVGTLPALLGISVLSSSVKGSVARMFFSFAGALSLFLGFTNIQSGLLLTGVDVFAFLPSTVTSSTTDPNVSFDKNGQQIISIEVHDSGYSASSFTVEAGKPTWLYANVPSKLSGCISSMAIPNFNILQPLNVGTNWIGPITPKKDFAFMCSMGMFRANVHVQS